MDPSKKCPGPDKIVSLVDENYLNLRDNILDELSKALYVALATDAWSANHKNFAGYTATWLDEALVRKFAVIAIRRVKGAHTFEVVRKEIIEIMKEFR